MIDEKYLESVQNLETLFKFVVRLSNDTHGRQVETRRIEVASEIFTKICLHLSSMLKLIPKSSYFCPSKELVIWDYTSIVILVRAIIDAYYVMYYLTIDEVNSNEIDFRFLVWDYHSENRRLKLLELIGSKRKEIPEIKKNVEDLRSKVKSHPNFLKLEKNLLKGIARGEIPFVLTNTEIALKAGISEHYHKASYMYLSSYIHTFPYSISQTSAVENTDQIPMLLKPYIDQCYGYICLCIRDFVIHVPDQKVYIVKELQEKIEMWEEIFKELFD